MDTARKRSACSYWGLLAAVALAAGGCSAPIVPPQRAPAPLSLTEPSRVSANAVSLAVGTNRWPEDNALLAETFLPVAVSVHNASTRPLCGDMARAVLRDAAGASVSSSSPQGVVARLLGPLALQAPAARVTPSAAVHADDGARLLFIRGGRGGLHSGHRYGPHAFGPSPYVFGPSPFFASPFAAPGFPFPYSPFSYSPFSYSPFPYNPFSYSPFSPFASPFSPSYPNPYPLSPYGYAVPFPPYAVPFPPYTVPFPP